MIKRVTLLFLAVLTFSTMQSISATDISATDTREQVTSNTLIFNTSYAEYDKKTEKKRIDDQIAAYDALYSRYLIQSRNDLFTLKIPEYIAIATYGITYVKHHHSVDGAENIVKNTTIHQSCDELYAELQTQAAEGLTPVEFILFNMKLGLLQEYHPEGYSLEFDQETKEILEDGRWKTTSFYESQNLYPLDSQYGPRPIITSLFEQDNEENYAFKPYVIYTPNGGFSISRIVDNLLRDDGKHRNLCALPIGTVDVKYSPHGLYNRTAFDFLIHDLFHAKTCWIALSLLEKNNLLSPITTINQEIKESIVKNFIFLLVHENTYNIIGYTAPFTSDSFFKTLKQNIDSSKTHIISMRSSFDPFTQILTGVLGNNVGYRGTSSDSELDKDMAASNIPNHYKGITNVRIDDKSSTFAYEVKRTGKLSHESPFYHGLRILKL